MKTFANKTVAVTGAGSGIGRALARELASRGANLALSDVNAKGLADTVAALTDVSVRVTSDILDVADREAVYAWAEKCAREHGQVHAIINNAGVSLSATVEEMSIKDFQWLMNINFWGVVSGTQAFLPLLQQADEGHIVNVSSVFGIIGVPTQSAYNAAKFAVRGFTESLRQELAGSSVKVSCVHPGGIRTNIVRGGRHYNDIRGGKVDMARMNRDFDKMARTTPEQAAKTIVEGMLKNKVRILIGQDAYVIDRMARLMPESYDKILAGFTRLGEKLAS